MISNFKFARKPRIPTSLVLDAFSRVPYSNNSSKQTSPDNATDMAFVSQLQIQVYFSDSIITTDTHIFLLCWREKNLGNCRWRQRVSFSSSRDKTSLGVTRRHPYINTQIAFRKASRFLSSSTPMSFFFTFDKNAFHWDNLYFVPPIL